MLKKEASKITGGLSAPGKMPEGAYSIPAASCQTGAKLALVPGTPCHGCYALKNRYIMPIQKAALERRYIIAELFRSGGNITRAAEALGIHRPQLSNLLKRLEIRKEDFEADRDKSAKAPGSP